MNLIQALPLSCPGSEKTHIFELNVIVCLNLLVLYTSLCVCVLCVCPCMCCLCVPLYVCLYRAEFHSVCWHLDSCVFMCFQVTIKLIAVDVFFGCADVLRVCVCMPVCICLCVFVD